MQRPVRVNELGLVAPPQRLDCLGGACPVAAKLGKCFVDEHHLYFTRRKFQADPLRRRFREHPFNIVRMPRCRHNSTWKGSIHSHFDGAPVPQADIMQEFLEEADLLKTLGVVAIESDKILQGMQGDSSSNNAMDALIENWFERQETMEQLLRRAKAECEVIRPYLHYPSYKTAYAAGALLLQAA